MYFFNAGVILSWVRILKENQIKSLWHRLFIRSKRICHVFVDSWGHLVYENGLWGGFKSLYFARFQSQTLVSSLTVATAKLSVAASYMCHFYWRIFKLFLIHILLENNSVVNNLYQTIFQEYHRIGHWITRDIYTKNTRKNVFVDVCLPACLFIHLFIYYLEVAL